MKQFLRSKRVWVAFVGIVAVGIGYYYWNGAAATTTSETARIMQKVEKGTVTTGIETSGKIEAAEILDLNVYKLTSRINAVSAVNGAHVEEGQLLYSFDDSDVAVTIANSQLSVRQAELDLAQKKQAVTDPNTTVNSLRVDIANLTAAIVRNEEDLRAALRTYLNKNLEAKPSSDRVAQQVTETEPIVGGLYTSTQRGEYLIEVYASQEDSGYSFTYSGLESGVSPVYLGKEASLGTRGLTVTFPSDALEIAARDKWVIAVPNVRASTYVTNTETYDQAVKDLNNTRSANKVALANKQTALAQALRGDTTATRDLDVESAALAIEKAQVSLSQGIDTREERSIVAPFSGTVEGVENVVVGATPTKDGTDSIDFGHLISDDFVATFSLGASDVAKVSVGQGVLVTLSSVPGSAPLRATVTEVSSLPDSSSVAQYAVRAILDTQGTSTPIALRDGMLADIEIVQEEREDVVRIPVSALTYRDRKAYVQVVSNPTEEELAQLARRGVVRMSTGSTGAVEREVTIGVRGTYYAEVTDGLAEGEYVVVTSTALTGTAEASVVQDARGMGPPRAASGNTSASRSSGGNSN